MFKVPAKIARLLLRKELKHLGVASALLLGLVSPLAISAPAHAAATTGSITNSVPTSTGGGGLNDINCPAGSVLGKVNSNSFAFDGSTALTQVTAVCNTVNSDGMSYAASGTLQSGSGGSSAGTGSNWLDCATQLGTGYAIVGFKVFKTTNGYSSGAQPICGKMASGNSNQQILPSYTLGSTSSSNVETLTCSAGTVALGLHMYTGSIVDKLGLNCGPITGATQTITLTNPGTKTYGAAAFALSATNTSGNSIALTSSTTSVCTVSGTTLTILTTGSCTVNANAVADTNYLAATQASQTFSVAQASQTALTITSTSGPTGAGLTLTTSGGSGTGAVSFVTSNGTATGCSVSGAVLTATTNGTCSVTATKAADTNYTSVSSAATTVTFSVSGSTCGTGITNTAISDVVISGGNGTPCLIRFFTNNSWTVPTGVNSVSVAIVGGGGGGGFGNNAGGGAGGEVLYNSTLGVTASTATTVSIGAGGTGGYQPGYYGGGRGGATQFGSTYAGGGQGGYGSTDPAPISTYGGSSGGGSFAHQTPDSAVAQALGGTWNSYVHNGGSGFGGGTNTGGGGGGAGTAGVNGANALGGTGGNGVTLSGAFSAFTVAGGGGGWYGGAATGALGGTGGGGQAVAGAYAWDSANSRPTTGSAGLANKGGGGGAGWAGGSGIVLLSYNLPQTVTFTNPGTKNFSATSFSVSATASLGTGAMSYASTTPSICTVSGNSVTMVNSGTCSLTATVAADSTYQSASASQSFTITAASALTPTFGTPTFASGTWTIPVTNYDSNYTYAFSVSAGSYSVGTPSGSTVNITVTPPANTTVALTANTSRAGYSGGSATSSAYYPGCATTVNTQSSYTSVSFLTVGTCMYSAPAAGLYDYLVVAGGGAGGSRAGGGGGAGGYLTSVGSTANGSTGSRLTLTANQILTVTVGAGGQISAAMGTVAGSSGGNSVLNTGSALTAIGGGYGGGGNNGCTQSVLNGANGGSGGGSTGGQATTGCNGFSPTYGTGTAGQGNNGNFGSAGAAVQWTGGGGGGAGTAGTIGNTNGTAGSGGSGLANSISGSAICYAGGGGGGAYGGYTSGAGGTCSGLTASGGAGSIGNSTASSALANTGGGGGGSGFNDSLSPANGTAGSGGSGVIVLRYVTALPAPTLTVTGITTSGFTLNVTNYDSNFTYTPTVTAGSATIGSASVSGSTVSYAITGVTSGASVTINVAVSLSGYTTANNSISGTANKTAQTISITSTAPVAAKVAGTTYTITATATSSLTPTFTIDAGSSAVCSISGSVVSFLTAGTCKVLADQAGNTQYFAATQVSQSFTVVQGTQTTLVVSNTSGSFGTSLTLGTTGGSGNGAVTFALVAGGTATGCAFTSAGVVTSTSGGTCLVTATKAADTNYTSITSATTTITLAAIAQTITFTAPTNRVVTSGAFLVAPTSTSGLAVTVTSSTTSVCTVSALTISLVSTGTCTLVAAQSGNASYSAATSVNQSFTVSGFTVTFASNYAGGAANTTQTVSTSNATYTSNAFSRTGWSFVSWNTVANGSGTSYGNAAAIALTADTTLYAQWVSNLIVDFDATDVNSWTGGTTVTNRNSSYPNLNLVTGTTGGAVTKTIVGNAQNLTFAGAVPLTGNTGSYGSLASTLNTSLFQSGFTLDVYGSLGTSVDNWERFVDLGHIKSGTAADASYNIDIGRYGTSNKAFLEVFNQTNGTTSIGQCVTTNDVLDGTMHRYTFVLDGSTCRIFVDGVQQNVYNLANTAINGSSIPYGLPINNIVWDSNFVGRSNWTGDASTEGKFRYVRIFNSATLPSALDTIDGGRLTYKTVTFSSTQTATALPSNLITNGTIALPSASNATRAGYTLGSWYTDSSLSALAGAPGANFAPTSTTTLYASWTATSNVVTYDTAGGSAVANGSFTTGGSLILPAAPTKSGYAFAGWFLAASGGTTIGAAGASYSPVATDALTIYAQWTANSNVVTYDTAGGSTLANGSFNTGGSLTLPAAPTKAGYAFAGWFLAASGGTTIGAAGASYSPVATGALTIYAQWTATSNVVTYDTSGGSAQANGSFNTGGSLTLPAAPTKAGYAFAGWFLAASGGTTIGAAGASYSPVATGALTIYAQWTANSNVVSYNTSGGSAQANGSFNTGGSLTLPAAPTKAGYAFAGWFLAASGGTTIGAAGASYSPVATGALTIYAQWTATSNVVTYDTSGGSAQANGSFNTGGSLTLPAAPTKAGYAFAGWFLAASGGTTIGAAGASYSPVATGALTIYAQWTANSNVVTYDTSGGSAVANGSFNTGGSLTLPAAPTKAGYAFAGWFLAASGGTTIGAAGASYSPVSTSALTIYAQWTATVYTINYNNNYSGSTDTTDTFVTSGTVTLPTPTRTGYTFNGWFDSSTGGTNVGAAGATYSPLSSTGLVNNLEFDDSTSYPGSGSTIYDISARLNSGVSGQINSTATGVTYSGSSPNYVTLAGNSSSYILTNVLTSRFPSAKISLFTWFAPTANNGVIVSDFGASATNSVWHDTMIEMVNGYLKFGFWTSAGFHTTAISTASALTLNQWYYAGFTYDGTTLRAYLNGVLVGSVAATRAAPQYNSYQQVFALGAVDTTNYGSGAAGAYKLGAFQVWNDGLSATAVSNNFAASCARFSVSGCSSQTLYAQWTGTTQSITYAANNGSGTVTNTTGALGSSVTLSNGSTLSRSGYTLSKWNTAADGSGTDYALSASVASMPSGGISLYAIWTANSNVVSYNTSGGSAQANGSFNTGGSLTLPAAPTKSGYAFAGWFLAASGGTTIGAAGASYSPVATGAVTIYAQWTANSYNVTYNAQGGSATTAGTFNTAGSITLALAPNKPGYAFAGWFATATGGSALTSPYSPGVTADITLYAQWTAVLNVVTYNTQGGSAQANGSFNTGGSLTLPAAASRDGYTFNGWFTAANGGSLAGAAAGTYSPSATTGITLYAQWTAISYNVTYNSAGGSSVIADTYSTGGTVALPAAPTKAGYSFNGWFAASSGGSALASPYSPVGFGNIVIYAQWAANSQTIAYNANNGSGSIASVSSYTDASVSLNSGSALGRTGYNLAKWNTLANGTGTDYALSATGITVPATGLTLYAIWTPINYSVTYNSNAAAAGSVPIDGINYNIGQNITVAANSGSLGKTGYSFAGWNTAADGSGTTYQSGNQILVGSANVILYARWTANTYTVTYNANGATGSAQRSAATVAGDSYTTGGSALALPDVGTLAKRGYNFGGWATSPGGSALTGSSATAYTTATNVTLYAVWTIKNLSISYDKGTAAGAAFMSFPVNTSGNFATTITVGSGVDARVTVGGNTYDFMGWSDGSSVYQAGTSYTLGDTPVTFTALWVPVYAVRYVFNGGTAAGNESVIDLECAGASSTCTDGQSITANATPTRAGYAFTGWRDQSGTAIAAAATFSVGATHYLLYAQWTAINYTITYHSGGGAVTPTQSALNLGQAFTVASGTTKTGYSFGGWSDGSQTLGGGASYTVGTSDIALTAVWIPNVYSVSYDWNGGHGTTVADASFTVGNSAVTLPLVADHVKDGYNFNGWSTTPNGSLEGQTFVPTADTVLYAIWGAGSYSLTMNPNGGSVSNTSYSVVNGSAQTLPTASRTHFHFDGWYSALTGGSRVGGAGDNYTPNGSGTLYARWTQDSLYGIGASTKIGSHTVTAGLSASFTYTVTGPNNSVSVTMPSGSLPDGTAMDVYVLSDTTFARNLIGAGSNFLVNLVVSWLASDGTVPSTTAGNPVSVTITDPAIKAGATLYILVGSTVQNAGVATQDGQATVSFTDDPQVYVVATVSSEPLNPVAVAHDGSATISWSAPATNGGSAISGYLVTANNGASCSTSGALTCDISGLTNGTAYTFTVEAINGVGSSVASATSNSITPQGAQTISFGALANRTLGTGTIQLSATATSGLTVAFGSGTPSVCSISGTTLTLLAAGTCSVSATQPGNTATLAAASVNRSFTVSPALLLATPSSGLTGTYNTNFSLVLGVSGGSGSNTFAVASGTLPQGLTLNSATGEISGVPSISGSASVAITATDANGATASTSSFTIAVSTAAQAALSVTSLVGTFGTPLVLTATGGSNAGAISYSVVAGTTTCSISNGTLIAAGAGTCLVVATRAADSYYSAVSSSSTSVIFDKAPQAALVLSTTTGTYGTPLAVQTSGGSGSGAVTYSEAAGTTSCSISGATVTAAGAGSCVITASKAGDNDYLAATSNATTVTFAAAGQAAVLVTSTSGTYGSSLTLSSSGGSGTGLVSYAVTDGTASCAINAGVLSATSAGTCLVTATKAADANHNLESSVATLVTFAHAAQSIGFGALANRTIGFGSTVLSATATSGLSVTFSSTNTLVCVVSGSSVTLVAAGVCTIAADQAGDNRFAPATQITQSFTVSPALTLATPSSGLTATYNSLFSLLLADAGGAGSHTFALANGSLPTGLTLDANTGLISGTPTWVGTSHIAVTAADANGASVATSVFDILVAKANQAPLVLAGASGTVGIAIVLAATGGNGTGAISYALDSASPLSCALSGTSLTATSAATCLVTATKLGDANYEQVASAAVSFVFVAAPISSGGGGSSIPVTPPVVVVTPPPTSTWAAPILHQPSGEIASAAPTTAVVIADGKIAEVTTAATTDHQGVKVTTPEWAFTIKVADPIANPTTGTSQPAVSGAQIVVTAGASVVVTGDSFQAGTLVKVWALSTPILIGTVLVKADGTFESKLEVPLELIAGNHTLVLQGLNSANQVQTAQAPMIVKAPEDSTGVPIGAGKIATRLLFASSGARVSRATQTLVRAFAAKLTAKSGIRLVATGHYRNTSSRVWASKLCLVRTKRIAKLLQDNRVTAIIKCSTVKDVAAKLPSQIYDLATSVAAKLG